MHENRRKRRLRMCRRIPAKTPTIAGRTEVLIEPELAALKGTHARKFRRLVPE